MNDLQAYLCRTICTEYPVYEAELIALLTTIFEPTDDLRRFDPTLASFVSEHMLCLRKVLITNKALLPLLCKAIPAKDRFLALAGCADLSALAVALSELRKGVGQVDETDALLDTFIGQNSVSEDAHQPVQSAPLITPKTLGRRKGSKSSKTEAQAEPAKLVVKSATGKVARNGDVSKPHVPNGRLLAAPPSATNLIRPRRSHPDTEIYESGPAPVPGAPKKIRRETPRIATSTGPSRPRTGTNWATTRSVSTHTQVSSARLKLGRSRQSLATNASSSARCAKCTTLPMRAI